MNKYKIDRGIGILVEDIEPNPWNPNVTSDRVNEAIGESLESYGQIIEILVRPHPNKQGKYQLIDGEHRLKQLILKKKELAIASIIYNLSDADAKKLTIILNETRGQADRVELSKVLGDINKDLGEETIKGLPYNQEELNELINLSKFDWDEFADDKPKPSSSGYETQWEMVLIKIPLEAFERVQDAYNLIEQERDGLHKDSAIAWGQVLESLAADYLSGQ